MKIGKNSVDNKDVSIDLKNLVATRLLIQANSGGGKSWLLRTILEQSHGEVQQIILDLEGEFLTLREHYDYLLVGKDGEVPASIKTAQLLARKILELNVSTIIDLSELKHHERILFVKRFLDSLVDSPKKLWKPCLIVIDEAHQFCPQGTKCESASSVIDLMTRGRKRGFCGILATQRISKLHKDACAETNNRLIGRTGQDVDRKRASEELGFTSKEDERSLRNLEPGEFYAFGPSITREVIKVRVGDTRTRHPEPGMDIQKASETPANIKKLLKNVIDLPQEAEKEIKTLNEYKTEIVRLKRELSKKPSPIVQKIMEVSKNFDGEREVYEKKITDLNIILNKISTLLNKTPNVKVNTFDTKGNVPSVRVESIPSNDGTLNKCARTIYSYLFQNPSRQFTRTQLGLISGYSPKSGGFSNAMALLNSNGLITKSGNLIGIGEVNAELATENAEVLNIDTWLLKLPKCPKEIFSHLLNNPDETYSREEIAELTGYSSKSGGFSNALAKLNTLELIKKEGNRLKLNPEILEVANGPS